MNCLQSALKFNEQNKTYRLYYDGDHVITLREPIGKFIPIELFGYETIRNSFDLTVQDVVRLKRYFKLI